MPLGFKRTQKRYNAARRSQRKDVRMEIKKMLVDDLSGSIKDCKVKNSCIFLNGLSRAHASHKKMKTRQKNDENYKLIGDKF